MKNWMEWRCFTNRLKTLENVKSHELIVGRRLIAGNRSLAIFNFFIDVPGSLRHWNEMQI